MKLKSFFKRLILVEEVIDRYSSPINGEILVYEDLFGKHSMRIGGVSQSGGLVVDIWRTAIKAVSCQLSAVSKCLVLGLGCGNAANIVSKTFPKAEIIGVEIDPVVIEVGKKYFEMDKIKNLKIVEGNAFENVPLFNIHNSLFNLILVDLYLGQSFPKEAESKEFIEGLKKILDKDGVVVFNRYYWGRFRQPAKDFEQKLKNYFPRVWSQKTISNLLLFCQK